MEIFKDFDDSGDFDTSQGLDIPDCNEGEHWWISRLVEGSKAKGTQHHFG